MDILQVSLSLSLSFSNLNGWSKRSFGNDWKESNFYGSLTGVHKEGVNKDREGWRGREIKKKGKKEKKRFWRHIIFLPEAAAGAHFEPSTFIVAYTIAAAAPNYINRAAYRKSQSAKKKKKKEGT